MSLQPLLPQPLPPEKLRLICAPEQFEFVTTADLEPNTTIIGQPRGTRSIEFGIGIRSQGYNIYVLGPMGTGRATAIERFLQARTRHEPTPKDWVYVHNFSVPHQPRGLDLPPGQGVVFQERMSRLIADLRLDLPQAFTTDSYREAVEDLRRLLDTRRHELLQGLRQTAVTQGFDLLNTPAGLSMAPVRNGQVLTARELQRLSLAEREALEKTQQALDKELETTLRQIHQLEAEARQQVRQMDREVAETAVRHHFETLRALYQDHEEVLLYLEEVHQDVLNQIDDFAPSEEGKMIDLRRYQVNVLVDHSQTIGAPIVVEQNPTYHNLFGRIEYEMLNGVVMTHFTNIKSGSLQRANGGYLILDAHDLLKEPLAWEALKRTLKAREIRLQTLATMDGSQVLAKSLDPEPIPLTLKIILTGSTSLYYALHEQDEEFNTLFKVRADFDSTMPRTEQHMQEYAVFIATRCHEEGLCHFDPSAVAKVVEYGSRLASYQKKLSTRFGAIADLVREASFWASRDGREVVTAGDVQQALTERVYRSNRLEEYYREQIAEGSLYVTVKGKVVGQVNGLSVIDTGDYAFGQPGRITARTFMGEDGVIHIERETEMSGPIHHKGVLTLSGYLGGMYAQHQPLSVTASLTFEQNYAGVEGDSAASTELYALLSSLSGLPLKQGIAVTGSVNQHGEIQPIGGVNEKIEGFYRVCCALGLTGEQGVIIPESNVENLMLHEDVVAAVAAGQFHIWPIHTLDEGIELLTDIPAGTRDETGQFPEGTVHYAVQKRLLELAQELKEFGENSGEDET